MATAPRNPPTSRSVPDPSCERAGQLFEFLCDLGYDRALDRLHAASHPVGPEIDYTKPRTSVGEAASAPEPTMNAADEPVVQFDLGEAFRQLGRGATVRLAEIVFDVDEAEARTIPVSEVRDGFFTCAAASAGLLHALNDFVLDWA